MAATRTIGNRLAPPKFILFFALLIAGVAVAATIMTRAQAVMAGFDLAAVLFLLACLPLSRLQPKEMRQTARDNDANRVILLVVTVVLSLVILITVAGELIRPANLSTIEKAAIITTLLLAWTFANMVYALHYAHLYYTSDDGGHDRAGLIFPGDTNEPVYSDFVYFSFTLGIALQTSDVVITSPSIRRVVTGHCLAAFVYNLGVLALAINILAG